MLYFFLSFFSCVLWCDTLVLWFGELRIFSFLCFFDYVSSLSFLERGLEIRVSWGSVRVGRWDARPFPGSQHIIKGWRREIYVVAPTILLTTSSLSLSISILFLSTPYFPLYATFLPVTGILYSVFFTTHNFESFHSSSSRIYVGADPALQLYHTYTSPKGTSSIITSTGMAAFKLVAENCGGLH